jgi:hypothetical protein
MLLESLKLEEKPVLKENQYEDGLKAGILPVTPRRK